jgi:hypothetical protein
MRTPGSDLDRAATQEGLNLSDTILLEVGGRPGRVPGVNVSIVRRGVVLSSSADEQPRILPWSRIKGWRVDPWPGEEGPYGALLTYASDTNTYMFGVPGAESTALAYLVDQLSRGFLSEARRPRQPESASSAATTTIQRRLKSVKPLLVLLLLIVLVAVVTLLLLQSAGVIHLPLLGGNGSQAPTGSIRPAFGTS